MACCEVQKVEAQLEIKVSAEEFHDILCSKTHQISKMSPETVKSVEILKGKWGSEGSIIYWNFIYNGKGCVSKEVVEGIDRKNNKVTYKVIEGDIMKHYKSFSWILQVTPHQENGSVVTWTLEYEKENSNVPDLNSLLQFVLKMSKDIDAHLTY